MQTGTEYRLRTPGGDIPLPPVMGLILKALVERAGYYVPADHLYDTLFNDRHQHEPRVCRRFVKDQIRYLRRRLRARGTDPLIGATKDMVGYTFRRFDRTTVATDLDTYAEAESALATESQKLPICDKNKAEGKQEQPKHQPVTYGTLAICHSSPWSFPERIPQEDRPYWVYGRRMISPNPKES